MTARSHGLFTVTPDWLLASMDDATVVRLTASCSHYTDAVIRNGITRLDQLLKGQRGESGSG